MDNRIKQLPPVSQKITSKGEKIFKRCFKIPDPCNYFSTKNTHSL